LRSNAGDILMGLPLISVLATRDNKQLVSENKVTAGIHDFLFIAKEKYPDFLSYESTLEEAAKFATAAFIQIRSFIDIREIRKIRQTAGNFTNLFEDVDDHIDINQHFVHPTFYGGILIPILGAIQTEAQILGVSEIDYLVENLHTDISKDMKEFLARVDVIHDDKLGRTGKFLLRRNALGGYTQLIYSYLPYLLNLNSLIADPKNAGQGKIIDRMQPENAQASNKLISNIVGRLIKHTKMREVEVVVDFGCGGGHFLLEFSKDNIQTIGLDISNSAIDSSRNLFESSGAEGTFYQGDLMNREVLAEISIKTRPDIAFINYILHDIAGYGGSREIGFKIVEEFLHNYRNYFPATPLYISESYFSKREVLREDDSSASIVFSFLHSISPQYLMTREELLSLLDFANFVIKDEIVHNYHRDGTPANSTLVAIPA